MSGNWYYRVVACTATCFPGDASGIEHGPPALLCRGRSLFSGVFPLGHGATLCDLPQGDPLRLSALAVRERVGIQGEESVVVELVVEEHPTLGRFFYWLIPVARLDHSDPFRAASGRGLNGWGLRAGMVRIHDGTLSIVSTGLSGMVRRAISGSFTSPNH